MFLKRKVWISKNFTLTDFCLCYQVFTMVFVDADEVLTDDASPLHPYINGLSTKTPCPTTVSLPIGSRGKHYRRDRLPHPSGGNRTFPQWPSPTTNALTYCTVTTGSEYRLTMQHFFVGRSTHFSTKLISWFYNLKISTYQNLQLYYYLKSSD